MIHSK